MPTPKPVHVTMVKKRLANGDPCDKCVQTEDMLRRRGAWERIDRVVWALEADDTSEGVKLGRTHGVAVAPFFIVRFEDGSESVYTSGMRLIRDHLEPREVSGLETPLASTADQVVQLAEAWREFAPDEIVRAARERFGDRCAIALAGAQDVVLVDMASKSGLAFRVFFVDTGRHHPETYALLDELGRHYGIEIPSLLPDHAKLTALLEEKGHNSFQRDGHAQCCAIRRVEPLARALEGCDAWIGLQDTGRELQAPAMPAVVELDEVHRGRGGPLVRVSPLVRWDKNDVWSYVRSNGVPHNELFTKGYRFIGCQPCTRPIRPDQEDREGLWWWEAPVAASGKAPRTGEGI